MMIVTGNPCSETSWIRESLNKFFSEADREEVNVKELLEIWRDILQNTHADFYDDDIEYITVDGTQNEYDDRGLDFDILSNTKE